MTVTANSVREDMLHLLANHFPLLTVTGETSQITVNPRTMLLELKAMSQTAMLGGYNSRAHSFGITYPEPASSDTSIAELHDLAEELYELFQLVEIGGTRYRVSDLKHEVRDGKLHFTMGITIRVKRVEPQAPRMGVIEQKAVMK
ncbi:phage tail terminator family protein [Paenibacillus paeoniae]|uniref:Uncharacterized protein n=1 Tax=Paenibacillus paeoniae TaxID=2292705 RepID=A0A371PEK5_9BACL|nr:hypothetical protein [Paenibacillus paeoniae]REK74383.1 hypothetical protein DX130_17835 [Paenibacillus paeoniae]